MYKVYWLDNNGDEQVETFTNYRTADDRVAALQDEGFYVSMYRIEEDTGREIRSPSMGYKV